MQSEQVINITAGKVQLEGNLTIPSDAIGIVIFAHGSGSGRHSPRNRFVASELHNHRIATLLIDLLTAEEEVIDDQTRELRFNIPMLAERLIAFSQYCKLQSATRHLKIGYFGASTGGGAALIAAAKEPSNIAAVVSRGGRPDLAGDFLPKVLAPTLLIIGGDDIQVLQLNEFAHKLLNSKSKLEIVPHASHLFEEPGALEQVAKLARDWFTKHFTETL
jgi:putative phosphoribosyl transferase